MENVVYLLGAGFSAPLGLPLMGNFLVKAKDMYWQHPDQFRHFSKVLDTIQKMHVCKSYFESDLSNIEEVLSIPEMQAIIGKSCSRHSCSLTTQIFLQERA